MGIRSWFRFSKPAEPAPAERIPGQLSETERETIDAVVCLFETGRLPSVESYSTASVLLDGAGITYGIHQTTAKSRLPAVLEGYYSNGGELEGFDLPSALRVCLSSVGMSPAKTTEDVERLMVALRRAGGDLKMQRVQRDVFKRFYWVPSHRAGELLQLRRPLSYLCVYDLGIHSGPPRIEQPLTTGMLARRRDDFPELPPSKGGGERLWVVRLLEARERFLLSFADELRRSTVYRVRALRELCDDDCWELERPLTVNIRRPSGRIEAHVIDEGMSSPLA